MQRFRFLFRPLCGAIAMSVLLGASLSNVALAQNNQKIVVAHRGASGYLPEHTLESKAMAYAMGADYIEQDVVMSKDDELIVIHDITLDRTTDVAEQFPDRARDDGKFYVVDFTLAEMLTLNVSEGFRVEDGRKQANFSARFPLAKSTFKLHTFAQEIELIQGLNYSTGRDVGIYPELKSPAFHAANGKDLGTAVLQVLKEYGYTKKTDKVFVQTFEFDELKRVHDTLMPALGIDLPLVQLVGGDDAQWMLTEAGVKEISAYADGMGPEKSMLVADESTKGNVKISEFLSFAHAQGLQVHPYTFRLDAGQIPDFAASFEDLLGIYLFDVGVDGVFTDFPDRAVEFIRSH